MSKRKTNWLLFASVALIACFGIANIASASADYDKGYDAGTQAAMERLKAGEKKAWYSPQSFTGPVGMLISYAQKPKALALRCLGETESEQYEKGFVKGFCDTVCEKQRKCFKGLENCHQINALGRLP